LSDEVYGLLENAGVDQAVIDRICKGIDELAQQAAYANEPCPRCMEDDRDRLDAQDAAERFC
jgi:hypothetical protein